MPSRARTSATSINFVITAIYTVTFANAIYQVIHVDNGNAVEFRDGVSTTVLLCASMCMIMALRFFFGNNNFMDYVFSSSEGSLRRFYHFLVTVLQSLILLGSSYLVTNPYEFIRWLTVLFCVEIVWYGGCLLFSRSSISDEMGLDRKLVKNELANGGVAVTSFLGLVTLESDPEALAWVVFAVFILNTAVDLKHNLSSYMGL